MTESHNRSQHGMDETTNFHPSPQQVPLSTRHPIKIGADGNKQLRNHPALYSSREHKLAWNRTGSSEQESNRLNSASPRSFREQVGFGGVRWDWEC